MPDARSQLPAVLIVVTAASLFGTLGILSRAADDLGLHPFAWVAWRAGMGALGLWVVIANRRGLRSMLAGIRAATPVERRWLLVAVVASAGLNLSIFVAFQRTAIALALLGFYTYPAMVTLVTAALGHERLDRMRVAALALAVAGMVAVVAGGLTPGSTVAIDVLGIALSLVAALCQTVFVVANRGYASIRNEEAMGVILGGSMLIAIAVTVLTAGVGALLVPFGNPGLLALLVGVGLFVAALPSFMFLTGIRRLGPVRAGILMLFEPLVGAALAALVLHEDLTTLQLAGGATILAAAVLVQRARAAVPRADAALRGEPEIAVAPAPGGP
ncbi:MAG TPA: DMT family transporter [Candidatus Limnocylindrales bacterium]|nr:DMT family transporter [Candidatus Limnocylindrales bacterium]